MASRGSRRGPVYVQLLLYAATAMGARGYGAQRAPPPCGHETPDVPRTIRHCFENDEWGYLATLPLRTQSVDTQRLYSGLLRSFVKWLDIQEVSQPRELTRELIEQYMLEERRRGLADATLSIKGCAIRSLLAFLVDHGVLLSAPRVRLPKVRRRLPVVPTVEEIERMRAACDDGEVLGVRDRAIIDVLYASGARVCEIWQLNLDDLDLEQKRFVIRNGKGGDEGVGHLIDRAVDSLRVWINECRATAPGSVHDQAVFVTRSGRRMPRRVIWAAVKKRVRMAGIEKPISPHSLRHALATHLLNAGVDLRTVQELLRHKAIQSTIVYTHVATARLHKALDTHHPFARVAQSPAP